ncbi:PLDc N-terminal domain-containing protein [Christiangramia aquimixticola]|uniref:PLDc N-terminal domain-containing protein n=1 Tax=Christiangramia aquimixticola TaxID=1697558 RepID=UPI003AA80FEF
MIGWILKYKLLVSILFYLLWGASFFATVLDLGENATEIFVWTCNIILFIFWLIILIDMIQVQIKNKIFWILSMFLLPFFAPVVYLFRRKNLIHLENNKFKS